jgi:hypothetical protein
MSDIYKGIITINEGETFGFSDIDPADREGFVHRVVRMDQGVYGSDSANNGLAIMVGVSIKVPVRTSFNFATDGFALDLTSLVSIKYSQLDIELSGDMLSATDGYRADDMLFQDSIRVFASVPNAVDVSTIITIPYTMRVEDVKLTDKIRDAINRRAYS